jgi:DMSO/TMAO reductase YedYZ heme-binding membrane subunit
MWSGINKALYEQGQKPSGSAMNEVLTTWHACFLFLMLLLFHRQRWKKRDPRNEGANSK